MGEIENFGNEIALQEKELTRLKGALVTSRHVVHSPVIGLVDRTEALSEEVLEHKMKSRTFCYASHLRLPN